METSIERSEMLPSGSLRIAARDDLLPLLALASSPEARRCLPQVLARKHQVLPLAVYAVSDRRVISLLASTNLAVEACQELRFATDCDLSFEMTAGSDVLSKAIDLLYLGDGSDGAVELEKVLARACSLSASDIHLEPFASGYRCRFRIGGRLVEAEKRIDAERGEKIIRQFAARCHLAAAKPGEPRDGGFVFSPTGEAVSVRCSFLPQVEGEKLVCRLLGGGVLSGYASGEHLGDREKRQMFEGLGIGKEDSSRLISALDTAGGAYLVCGPTGSGKTTLLHACLLALDRRGSHVASLESPVERRLNGVSQVEYGRGADTERLLASMLRQDIDSLLIGELRDREGVNLFFEAALTGHRLFSTLHSSNCVEACLRLGRMGMDFADVALALRCIVSCRLLPRLCQSCRQSRLLTADECRILRLPQVLPVYYASGCHFCLQSGTMGVCGLQEFMFLDPDLRMQLARVRSHAAEISLEALKDFVVSAVRSGYRPLRQQAKNLLLKGEISIEVFRANV